MSRHSHYDDPNNYFQRLQSYTSSQPSFSNPGSVAAGSTSNLTKPERYCDSPPKPRNRSNSLRPEHGRSGSAARSWHSSSAESFDDEKSIISLRSENLREHDAADEPPRSRWSRRRKCAVGAVILSLCLLALIIGLAVHFSKPTFNYTPSYAQVNNTAAFSSGGATHNNPNNTADGIGSGQDRYVYYTGGPINFPKSSEWISFNDMWQANVNSIQTSCTVLGYSPDNSQSDTQDIYNAIQNRANASLVDHRYILAVVLQESHGCVNVGHTTSSGGVTNPGLMQSHNGHSFSSAFPSLSILAMVQDGTQGTTSGPGLVQNLNQYGNPYSAARGYNSGYIPKSGDLSEAAGATACYVSDIANRLTGWVNAKSTCPGDTD